MPSEEVLNQVIVNIPNFLGFVIAVYFLAKANSALVGMNSRLIEALIKRENCEDDSNRSVELKG